MTPLNVPDVVIDAPPVRSVVYDRFGGVMGAFSVQDRSPVALRSVPQVLIDAVLSIEDRHYYEHHGVDWAGAARALYKDVNSGAVVQGGSTITEQLVKNSFPGIDKRDLRTKLRQAVLALQLETELTKSQILEDYLNLMYFGNGAYGVKAATERYFDEPLSALTLPQAALLAGLLQAPEALNPVTHPDRAARRRYEVLRAMVANHKATPAAARAANADPLPIRAHYPLTHRLDYYIAEVRNRLIDGDPNAQPDPARALGATPLARARALYRGGLRIYTAYDPHLQLAAQAALDQVLPASRFTASVVVIDNHDGGVSAIANGRPFSRSQFDPATQGAGRQAGSSFKTFTLAAALSQGYNPDDTVVADPLFATYADPAWNPLHGDCHGGTPTLRTAIAISDNCAFVRLEMSLGPAHHGRDGVKQVIDTAHRMGIDSATSFDPTALSTTLGTQGVHPLEMAQAYSVLPDDGILLPATFITKIVGSHNIVLYQDTNTGHRVLSSNVARTETNMLEDVLRHGTASRTLANFPRPAAGKTGTTDNNVDAWFIGYTPQYTAAVWMGNPDAETPMLGLPVGPVFGATYPAQIWQQFMLTATAGLPPLDFAPPDPAQWSPPTSIDETGRHVAPARNPERTQATHPPRTPRPPRPARPRGSPRQQPPPPRTNQPPGHRHRHGGGSG